MLGRVIVWSAFVVWLRGFWQKSTWFASVTVAVITIGMITLAHGEYLEFAEASEVTRHVALSFAVKWGVIAGVCIVALAVIYKNKKRRIQSTTLSTHSQPKQSESELPDGVDLDRPRSAAERILDESPP